MQYNKILVVVPDALGDFLAKTPFLEKLKTAYPQSTIGVVASRRNIDLARANPNVDLVHFLDVRKKRSLVPLLWQIRQEKYDLLIDIWVRNFSSSLKLFMMLSGIKTKISIKKISKFRELKYERYYDRVFNISEGHVRMAYNNILAYLGASPVTEQTRHHYPLKTETIEKARAYVKSPSIVLVCEGSRLGNTLPAATCADIIYGLLNARPELNIFLSSSPGKNNIASSIANAMMLENVKALPDIDGSLDFTAAVVSLADAIISTSTGTLHIADAFDIPTVGIYQKGYNTSLTPEYAGTYHFLPLTTKHTVIYSEDTHDAFPVDVNAVAEATLQYINDSTAMPVGQNDPGPGNAGRGTEHAA